MPDDLITKSQGDEIISLLKKILVEVEKISSDVRFEIKGGVDASCHYLVGIQREIEEIRKHK